MSGDATIERERFWSAVNAALDAGTDPLAVPLVQEWIAENPSDGDEVARLLRRVEVVARAPRRKPRRLVLSAAGVLLAGAVVTLLAIRPTTHRPDEQQSELQGTPPREPRSCVLHYTLEVVREGVDSSTTVLAAPGRTARSHIALLGATTIVSSLEGQSP